MIKSIGVCCQLVIFLRASYFLLKNKKGRIKNNNLLDSTHQLTAYYLGIVLSIDNQQIK